MVLLSLPFTGLAPLWNTQAERTKKHNKKLEKRFQRLKKMDEDTIEDIAEKHGCMADLYLDSGGSEKKANKSLKVSSSSSVYTIYSFIRAR